MESLAPAPPMASRASQRRGKSMTAKSEAQNIEIYVEENQVGQVVEDMIARLLKAKPENPRLWLLNQMEQDLSEECDDLSEADLHKLFAVTRRITSEIMPIDTINSVISETMQILNCDIVSLFALEKKSEMLLLYASNLETPIKVNKGQGIAGTVFNTLKTVNIPDCYKDRRFDKSFDRKSGYYTRSLIAVPIADYEGKAIGVIQAINKMPLEVDDKSVDPSAPTGHRAIPFHRNDEKILLHLTQHVAIAMRNAEVYREAIAASERATGLLNTIQSLSQDLGTQSLLLTITMHANKIVSAQRSTVFLVDELQKQLWSVSTDTGQEIRIPKHAGIAGQCCCEGIVINIPDAYADPRFNQAIDKKTGFKTQSILAVPMWDDMSESGAAPAHQRKSIGSYKAEEKTGPKVIGVIQMINKVSFDGQLEIFDESDIEVMELFAKFVGPKLTNSAMLSKRKSEISTTSEAELGLRKVADSLSNSPATQQHYNTSKRMSASALEGLTEPAFIEGEEEEEDDF